MSARHFLGFLQTVGKTTDEHPTRFRWTTDATNRLEIVRSIAKNAAIALSAFIFTAGVSPYYRWTATVVYGLCALVGIAALTFSMFRLPMRTVQPPLKGRRQIIFGVFLWFVGVMVLGSIAFGYISSLASAPSPISITEIRAALLL